MTLQEYQEVISTHMPLYIPGWKSSRTCRARTVRDEIAYSCESHVCVLLAHSWYAILRYHHTRCDEWDNTRVPCVVRVLHVFHSIAHLLHAVLALGSAPCNMENSMFVTPVNTHVAHTIVVCGGVGRWSALRIISAWFSTQQTPHEYSWTMLETQEPFHPGMYIISLHK